MKKGVKMVDMSIHDVSGVVGWCLGAYSEVENTYASMSEMEMLGDSEKRSDLLRPRSDLRRLARLPRYGQKENVGEDDRKSFGSLCERTRNPTAPPAWS